MTTTYLASAANIIWKVIASYGLDPAAIFGEAHIEPEIIMQPGCRISYQSYDRLWELTVEKIDDPCLGIRAAEYWHPSHLNALGYAWLASSTLHEALNRLARYIHIVTETIEIEMDQQPQQFELIVNYNWLKSEIPQRADSKIVTIMTMCRLNFGNELRPVVVRLKHSDPGCGNQFQDFFRAPVRFNQERNSITFQVADLHLKLSGANPYIAEIHDNIVTEYLKHIQKNDIVQRTKSIIVNKLPSGNVSSAMVAGEMFMSVRSYQRALKQAGVTYRSVLNQTRLELAEKYLPTADIELQEIAFLLGFTEYSTFSRAFKLWTGKTPVQVRLAAR